MWQWSTVLTSGGLFGGATTCNFIYTCQESEQKYWRLATNTNDWCCRPLFWCCRPVVWCCRPVFLSCITPCHPMATVFRFTSRNQSFRHRAEDIFFSLTKSFRKHLPPPLPPPSPTYTPNPGIHGSGKIFIWWRPAWMRLDAGGGSGRSQRQILPLRGANVAGCDVRIHSPQADFYPAIHISRNQIRITVENYIFSGVLPSSTHF